MSRRLVIVLRQISDALGGLRQSGKGEHGANSSSRQRRVASRITTWAGELELARMLFRQRLRVISYHRFVDGGASLAPGLRRQCAHIRSRYSPVGLGDLERWLFNGDVPPPYSVLVTVDDGHEDFATVAQPVFTEFEIPVIAFVASDFIDGRDWLWFDKVEYACLRSPRSVGNIEIGADLLTVELGDHEGRKAAAALIVETLKRVPDDVRRAVLRGLEEALGCPIPLQPPREYAPISWSQARAAMQSGVTFGAHTLSHPILSRITSQAFLEAEVRQCRTRLETKLDVPVTSFAYPNGTAADVTPAVTQAVRSAGYSTAFLSIPGLVSPHSDPVQLPRLWADPHSRTDVFDSQLAGLRALLASWVDRRRTLTP